MRSGSCESLEPQLAQVVTSRNASASSSPSHRTLIQPGETLRGMVLATLKRLADQLRTVLADLDPERLSGADASKLLQAFTDLEKLAIGGKLLTARRIESSNVWRTNGHRSAASHIAETSGTGIGPP